MPAKSDLPSRWIATAFLLAFLLISPLLDANERKKESPAGLEPTPQVADLDRSPVDLASSPDERFLVTANQRANTLSLVDLADRSVASEVSCGAHPIDIEFVGDRRLVVTCQWSGDLQVFDVASGSLQLVDSIHVGMDPHGLAVTGDGRRVYVGLTASAQVAEVDLESLSETRRFDVGKWPRYLTISNDDKRLAVGFGGDAKVGVIDLASGELLYDEPIMYGTNFGQMRTSKDGQHAYFCWMVYRTNPITPGNIRRGWVLASRIGRIRFDGPAYREAISLDVPGMAVADPSDLEITPDGQKLVASASGTHELLVYRLPDMPLVAEGGPGDLIDRRLQYDSDRFHRIEVGGRPMGMRIASDSTTVYVANYLRNSVQLVDLGSKQVVEEIDLGSAPEKSLARRGMEIFYDGQRSLDQWYSCHSCHQDGGINARPMDTWNDGTEMTLKTVLPLYDVTKTFPWTWHGWQTDLTDSMHKSITSTMQGEAPSDNDKRALIAFLGSLQTPPNPYRAKDGTISDAAKRGKRVFFSRKAGCVDCHNGPHHSDGKIHDVGLGSKSDHYKGYNTPSLVGVYRKVRLLHTGRARDLARVVEDLHRPELVNGEGDLTEQETADLIEYLKTL